MSKVVDVPSPRYVSASLAKQATPPLVYTSLRYVPPPKLAHFVVTIFILSHWPSSGLFVNTPYFSFFTVPTAK
jgi:hypothetical protein